MCTREQFGKKVNGDTPHAVNMRPPPEGVCHRPVQSRSAFQAEGAKESIYRRERSGKC